MGADRREAAHIHIHHETTQRAPNVWKAVDPEDPEDPKTCLVSCVQLCLRSTPFGDSPRHHP